MSKTPSERILWITEDGTPPAEISPWLREGYDLFFCSTSKLKELVERLRREEESPVTVLLDGGLEAPLRVARQAYQLSPLSHLIFLIESPRRARFRESMSPAPMIGTNWTIVEPRGEEFRLALETSVRAGRQRRQLRTSLDRINLKLASGRPLRDSSEYRRLVISDRHLATILEHAQDAIMSLDRQARVVTWNRGAAELFGYSGEEASGMAMQELVVSRQREESAAWFRAAAAGTPIISREVAFLRRSGGTFTAETTVAPVRDESGAVIAVSLTAHDVTARKETESELRQIRRDLERRVNERTEALRALNKELEAFTYSASHDLRAPLRGIDGFSQALLEDYAEALDESARRYIERIRAGARRMGDIIDSLLLLSRISQAQLHVRKVDLGKMAEEIVEEMRDVDRERTIDFQVEEGLQAQADPQLIRIALENLLGNAWKFTREREPAVIQVGRMSDRDATFFVRDNGAGFDMTYGEKLFVPFQRLHHPLRFEGSGIGLGTVQRVISRHGGRVWAESVPEQGATFYFTLPPKSP